MKHGALFFGLLGAVLITGGGVFFLVSEGKSRVARTPEALEASLESIPLPPPDPAPASQVPAPRAAARLPKAVLVPLPPAAPSPVAPPAPQQEFSLIPVDQPPPSGKSPVPPPADQGGGKQVQKEEQAGFININTAGYEELQEITGVGPVLARRIMEWREQNGQFQNTEEIKNVKGIGEKTFEKMMNEIVI